MLSLYLGYVLTIYDMMNLPPDSCNIESFYTGSSRFDYATLDPSNNLVTLKRLSNNMGSKTTVTYTRNFPTTQIASNRSILTTLTKQPNGTYMRDVRKGIIKMKGMCEEDLVCNSIIGQDESRIIDEVVAEVQALTRANIGNFDNVLEGIEGRSSVPRPTFFGNGFDNSRNTEPMIQASLNKLYKFFE